LIVNEANGKALGTTQNPNNRSAAVVTIEDDIIPSIDNTVCELTLGGSTGAWTFKDGNNGYLYAAGGGNYLRTQSTLSDKGRWHITINNGVAAIVSNGNVTQNTIMFNPNGSNPIFSCYASGQQEVCLFRRTELEDYPAEQQVVLEAGWNWWAPTVATSVEELQTALGDNLQSIQSQNGTPTGGLVAGQMYKIQTTTACIFMLSGTPFTNASVTITNGINWFGCIGTESQSLTALGISPATGDKVVSQDGGFAIFNGTAWKGTLTSLQPGKGYVYYSTAFQQKTLVF
jgi:hypothetical protein